MVVVAVEKYLSVSTGIELESSVFTDKQIANLQVEDLQELDFVRVCPGLLPQEILLEFFSSHNYVTLKLQLCKGFFALLEVARNNFFELCF